jgi:diphthine-ammonia ligase
VIRNIDETTSGESSKDELLIHWEISEFKDSGASYAIVCFRGEGNGNVFVKIELLLTHHDQEISTFRGWRRLLVNLDLVFCPYAYSTKAHENICVRVPFTPHKLVYTRASVASAIEGLFGQGTHLPITSIPCKSISTMNYDNWDYAICILGN